MQMPGRTFNSQESQYGFDGMQKVDEISGSGNHYTAEFWEYDPRTGLRWNTDPVVKPWESPYACFSDNPILNADPSGDDAAPVKTEMKEAEPEVGNSGFDKKSNFYDKDNKLVKHVEDGSNAAFKQTGSGVDLHYEFKGYENQGGKDEVTGQAVTSVIQEQQQLNLSNPSLQPGAGGVTSHCNQATQCIESAVGSAINKNIFTPGRANDVYTTLLTNPTYKNVDLATATKTATAGGLVIAAYKNPVAGKSGHLATFSVGENIQKGSLANIGYSKGVTNFVNPTGTQANGWRDAAFKSSDWNNNVKFYILTIPLKRQ
jgi:hypothetical protein